MAVGLAVGVAVGSSVVVGVGEGVSVAVGDSVADGDLVGNGPGNSADNRLDAIRNMLERARDLINIGDMVGACRHLEAAFLKCDGESPPPEFITGDADAVEELNNMIFELMDELGCE